MKYKINTKVLFGRKSSDPVESLKDVWDVVRAIIYFMEVGDFALTEDAYSRMDEDGKQYFIGVKEQHEK